jgi:PTH2 family peptidyl-tRNA hydrolase
MYKQIIIARKDLNMSHGKLAAQVSHASMAFLVSIIKNNTKKYDKHKYRVWKGDLPWEECSIEDHIPQHYRRGDLEQWANQARSRNEDCFYARPVDIKQPYGEFELCEPSYHFETKVGIDKNLYDQWLNGEYTKCVLQAKNKNKLLSAKTMAEDLGMKEGEDFFLIYDNCHTELEPEDDGKTLTCIGFKPMDSETIDNIGKKYQLYI